MSIETEIQHQTVAIYQLTDAIQKLVDQNQQLLELIIDNLSEPESQPMRDMEGNPI